MFIVLGLFGILGALYLVNAFSLRGFSDCADVGGCSLEASVLTAAAELYMIQEQVDVLPGVGTGAKRHERFLIEAGFLGQLSRKYDLQADGTVIAADDRCP